MIEKDKEIILLSEKEHIRSRPTVYVGSVKPTVEKIPIIRDNKIITEDKNISVGMYKIFNEILDNSLDEAKRMNGKMKEISIHVDSKSNSIKIKDTGNGFYKGTKINKKSGKTNIETAVSMLRAGSNFKEHLTKESVIGVNGLGAALTNVLSKKFKIITTNDTHYYEKEWIDFESSNSNVIIRKKKTKDKKGTEINFEPLDRIFGGYKWDLEIIRTFLTFKHRIAKSDQVLNKLKIKLYWDNKIVDISGEFLPAEVFIIKTSIGEIAIWEKYESSTSVSFINSSMCSGIHQKIVTGLINDKLEDSLGHHFYDTYISLNLQPKIVEFGDQNKTKFVTRKEIIDPILTRVIGPKLSKFYTTKLFKKIRTKVEQRKDDESLKQIRKEKKKVNIKFSRKYFPPTSRSAKNLFIVEGLSAMGSILQKRNPANDGVYALKGKIKNARTLASLADNKEILELMQILNLDIERPDLKCPYEKIVIATDADCLHEDTLIITNKGNKKISEIIPGDKVLTHKNEYKDIIRVTEKESDEYIELLVNEVVIKCTLGHEFPILRDGEIILEKAENIKNEDFIFIKK